jgi:protein TonB
LQLSGDPEEQIYKIGDGVSAPKLIHKVEPGYTRRAKKAKLHGTVVLSIVVSSVGVPERIEVTTGVDPDLDAEAIKTVSMWRFQAGEKDGKPVAVRANVEVTFRLCCRW